AVPSVRTNRKTKSNDRARSIARSIALERRRPPGGLIRRAWRSARRGAGRGSADRGLFVGFVRSSRRCLQRPALGRSTSTRLPTTQLKGKPPTRATTLCDQGGAPRGAAGRLLYSINAHIGGPRGQTGKHRGQHYEPGSAALKFIASSNLVGFCAPGQRA